MKETIDKLDKLISEYSLKLLDIPEEKISEKISPVKWSGKEILGHLIDSASNNHQRFVRTQQINHLLFPGYAQETWVKLQHYQDEQWRELVNLWQSFNKHIIHLLRQIPEEKYDNHCVIGNDSPKPFTQLVEEYLDHVEHHLQQIINLSF